VTEVISGADRLRSARPPAEPADPSTGSTTEAFWTVLREMQDRCPVVHSAAQGGFSVLTRRDDVISAAQDWETFSSASGVAPIPVRHGRLRLPAAADRL